MNRIFLLTATLVCYLSISAFGQTEKLSLIQGEKFVLKSEILDQDREILVSLPPDYEAGDGSYPVHIILDAEITFEAYAGVVHIMHMAEQIPDAIVVGIPNIDRSFDLDFMRNGAKFLEFITQELIPVIDGDYRTTEERLIAGYSVAGNYVMYAFFYGQEYFSRFLSGSPYGMHLFFKSLNLLPDGFAKPKVVYTSMGSEDKPEQVGPFLEFCEELARIPIDGFEFRYELLDHKDHNTNILSNWEDGLSYLYRNWNPKP